ncbi:NUDIX hydrolase domain-like protein [Poronia punctata]|nr:NUDIX hydrolase domain-like protein [Poronia punctata]
MTDTIIPPPKIIGTKAAERSYTNRHAIRIVAITREGAVGLIHVKKGNYYKLPGGGVEKDEDHLEAAVREVLEETGAIVSIREGRCIATTEEFRHDLHQMSYVYVADVVDASGRPELTEDEEVDGLTHEWVPLKRALEMMRGVQPTSELGRFIKERDTYLLGEVDKVLGS